MILVRALRQLLELLVPLEVLKAYRAGLFSCITPLKPSRLFDRFYLLLWEALGHLSISLLEL